MSREFLADRCEKTLIKRMMCQKAVKSYQSNGDRRRSVLLAENRESFGGTLNYIKAIKSAVHEEWRIRELFNIAVTIH